MKAYLKTADGLRCTVDVEELRPNIYRTLELSGRDAVNLYKDGLPDGGMLEIHAREYRLESAKGEMGWYKEVLRHEERPRLLDRQTVLAQRISRLPDWMQAALDGTIETIEKALSAPPPQTGGGACEGGKAGKA